MISYVKKAYPRPLTPQAAEKMPLEGTPTCYGGVCLSHRKTWCITWQDKPSIAIAYKIHIAPRGDRIVMGRIRLVSMSCVPIKNYAFSIAVPEQ